MSESRYVYDKPSVALVTKARYRDVDEIRYTIYNIQYQDGSGESLKIKESDSVVSEVVEQEVREVIDAFNIKGNHPSYHDEQVLRLALHWSTLHEALVKLTERSRLRKDK